MVANKNVHLLEVQELVDLRFPHAEFTSYAIALVQVHIRDHSFSTYAKLSEKLTFLTS